jgi:uncharacterized membrane protein
MRLRWTALSLYVLLACGCGGADDPAGPVSGQGGAGAGSASCDAAPSFEAVTAFIKCRMCHASTRSGADRSGAPPTINFDSEASASANASDALHMVQSGVMPPSSSGIKLSDAEKEQLYAWALCVNP